MAPTSGALGLDRAEQARVAALLGGIAAASLLCFVASVAIGKAYPLLAGLGVVAFVFGLRHGVDADHIAAIDNTTRKLLQDGRKPLTVGFWFSLGHSTVVVALVLALVVATRFVTAALPSLRAAGGVVGSTVSGTFLWILGLLNAVIVVEIWRVFRGLRDGTLDEAALEEQLLRRGVLNRVFGRLFGAVREPWHIYPVGLLFGLGFDTASEIALIALSVGVGVSASVPPWMVLVLPLMFTCGMVLVDTLDGVAMRLAYGWAFLKPVRKVYYNLTLTVISVLVALVIGTVELLQVVSGELNLSGGFWDWLGGLDFGTLGWGILGLFVASWVVAMAYYRWRGYERLEGRGARQP